MKKKILNSIVLIVLFSHFCLKNSYAQAVNNQTQTQAQSQTPTQLQPQAQLQYSLEKSSIDNQFNFIITYSSKYNEFKVVKESWLYIVKGHVSDTIKSYTKQIAQIKDSLSGKNKIIDSLKMEVSKSLDKFNSTNNEKNSLNFMGLSLNKSAYNSMVWGIISILILLIVILVLLFKRSNTVTVQTKQDLADLKSEFEEHRKKALLREEKLARQYLDELNKYKK